MTKPLYKYFTGIPHIYAGEHPSIVKDRVSNCERIEQLMNEGFTDFFDLTEKFELSSYTQWLRPDNLYTNFPIKNLSVPISIEDTYKLIQTISEISLQGNGRKVYIHCYGGVGRTGMIVACLLSYYYHDYDYECVMGRFQEAYKNYTKSAYMNAPETTTQREFIKQLIQFMKSEKNKI